VRELVEQLAVGALRQKLQEMARATAAETGNPFFRALQILERLRD
jgi:hypothetical protein